MMALTKPNGRYLESIGMPAAVASALGNTISAGSQKRGFDLLGDSRQNFQNVPLGSQNNSHFFNMANALNGQRYVCNNMLGIAGDRSDQYLAAGLATALASTSKYCVIWSIINDLDAGATADQAWNGGTYTPTVTGVPVTNIGILPACQQLIAAGKTPILLSEIGIGGVSAAIVTGCSRYNELCRELAETGQIIYIDVTPVLWDPSAALSNTIAFLAGRMQDVLHPNGLGSYYMAQLFINALPDVPPLNVVPCALSEDPNQQILGNNLFTYETGGTISGGTVTGLAPADWTLLVPTGWTVALTYVAEPNGVGHELQLAITATGAGIVQLINQSPLGNIQPGNIIQAGASFNVLAGASPNFVGFDTELYAYAAGNVLIAAGLDYFNGGVSNQGPSVAYSYQTKTPKVVTPVGTAIGNAYVQMTGSFTAAGTATVQISKSWCRQRAS
jgi:hypothetical protein